MNTKICFNKSAGIIIGVIVLIVIGTFIITRLTNVKTSTNSRAVEPLCTGLLQDECIDNCVWEDNACVSLLTSIIAPTEQPLEICPKGLECTTDNNSEYDWDTAGYAPCRTIDTRGVETKMRCCPRGLVRTIVDGIEPGICDCPKGKLKGEFTSAEDEGVCIEYKPVSKKDKSVGDRCISGLSCIGGTIKEESPRGSQFCFDAEGAGQFCCQPGDTVTIPTDTSLKSFCRKNAWYSMW